MGFTELRRQFNWRNFLICYLVSCGQIAFGYPASIIGTTLGEPSFLIYMGLLDLKTEKLTPKADQLIGAMSGVFQVSVLSYLPVLDTDSFRPEQFSAFLLAAMSWTNGGGKPACTIVLPFR